MFNLELAIHQWCVRVLQSHSIKNNKIDELKDHLYCSVEALQAEGLSEQDAFNQAINKLGEDKTLKESYDTNLTALNKLCAFEYGKVGDFAGSTSGDNLMKIYKKTMLTNAVLWAAAMIATAIILRGNEEQAQPILFILVALSVTSVITLKKNFKKNDNQQS
ncbi:permease prefix domain 1-containing protein [Thalassotalea atypica]|uniref:permease prefix domain 1-containing protein n=1 Tax=Thalassotalea atypica TaxID=2054316 RepID=UPI00257386C8|nr:permease prefix domain 1-containing protein [Thalassotalea atypica]